MMELPNSMTSFINILAKLPQQKIAQTISFVLLLYIAYLAAQLTWLLMPSPENSLINDHQVIKSDTKKQPVSINALQALNLFGIYDALPAEKVIEIQDAPETQLNLTLAAAVASDDINASAAVIENKGKQETYGIGDMIVDTKATLEQVLIDRVLIKHSGRMETLMLDGFDYQKLSSSKVSKVQNTKDKQKQERPSPSNDRVMDQRDNKELSKQASTLKEDINEDPSKIADYLTITPQRENGNIVGYQLRPGKQPEFFTNAGLISGDLAIQMNGYDLTEPSEAAQALMALKTEQQISLLVDRKDGTTEILISIDN